MTEVKRLYSDTKTKEKVVTEPEKYVTRWQARESRQESQ